MPALDPGFADDPSLLRAVLDATSLLVLVVDGHGFVRGANQAVARATGLPPEAALRPVWELAALPVERAGLQANFAALRVERLPRGLMFHLTRRRDGGVDATRLIDWVVGVMNEGPGAPLVVLSGIDVTDRVVAEQHLRDSEALHNLILDRLPAIVWTTDNELRTTFSAGGGLTALGLGPGDVSMAGTTIYSYFQTDDPNHPGVAPHLRALRGEATVFEMDWFDRHYHTRVEPLRDRNDNIIGTIGLSLDVTEQERTARALVQTERHLRRLVDADVIGVFFWEENGRVTQANQAFLDMVGYTRDQLVSGGVSWRAMTPPEFRFVDDRALEEARTTGRCTPYEKKYRAKDGTLIPVLIGAASVEGATDPLAGVAFVVDLREQVRLREARDRLLLQEQRARVETELANARLLLLVEGSKRLARTMNPAETLETLAALAVPGLADWSYVMHRGWNGGPSLVASAHGDPHRAALLRTLHECRPDPAAPEGPPKVFRTAQLARYDDIQPEQLMPEAPGGTVVGTRDPAQLHVLRELGMRSCLCVPIVGRGGVDAVMMLVSAADPHRYGDEDIVLARDLAARAAVSLENGRLLFEALDAVRARDEFLAVAAHELRTPLTSLLLHLQMLERAVAREKPDAAAARRDVAAANGQARRMSSLVNGLLDVARLASNRMWLQLEDLDLRALIDGLLTTMAPDLQRAGCRVVVAMPERVTGRWDRVRLEQVLTNLLTNAMKFGAGHPIEVGVRATGTDVAISVRDHGIGISREDQARIFGRFERAVSSRHYGGLGLGLYISAQILRAHNGSLRVESEPGQGACFIVQLPRGPQYASLSSEAAPSAPP